MAPIAKLFASWTKPKEPIDVELSLSPQSRRWTKAEVETQFRSLNKKVQPISCPRLPAPRIPEAITKINYSRNNPTAIHYYISHDPSWLAHRMLLQAQYRSPTRYSRQEMYFLAEEGELIVRVNGRPLTEAERWQIEHVPETVELKDCQPTDMRMVTGVAMILPAWTIYCLVVGEKDALVTTGCVVPRGRLGKCTTMTLTVESLKLMRMQGGFT